MTYDLAASLCTVDSALSCAQTSIHAPIDDSSLVSEGVLEQLIELNC